jgi:3-hydroxy-9,10-secoandrosta-1,3,5(10)-triene-9,17-dione monooxygenase
MAHAVNNGTTDQPGGQPRGISAQCESLLEQARAVGPLLSEYADYADQNLQLADEVVEELINRQLFRLWQPRRYDGLEVDVLTQMVVTEELAKHCSSAGWVTALYGACAFFAGLYSDEARDEVFGADKNARVCGILAPSAKVREVPGGIKVDALWAYASGATHATWATVGAPRSGGADGTSLLLIPLSDVEIDLTWDPTGMRGTASNTLRATDLFVPHHRILSFFAADGAIAGHIPNEHSEEALYRTPLAGFASACIVGPLIGMAKAALAHTLDHVVDRPVAYTFATDQSALVSTQLAIAEAATKIDSAELHIHRAARDLDDAAKTSKELSLLVRARIRHDVAYGTQLLRESMAICQQVNGSSDMARGRSFERVWRDFSTSSLHAVLNLTTTAEVYGKILCGHDPSGLSGLY